MTKRQFSTHVAHPERVDALHDLVPEWMQSSLDEWIQGQLIDQSYGVDRELIRELERLLRVDLISGEAARESIKAVFRKINDDPNLKLDVVDGILRLRGTPYSGSDVLEAILLQSGSKWRVANNEDYEYYLEERVDEAVTKAAEDLIGEGGDVAKYMAKAWNEAFGRSPNPSAAYSNAIKAVEAASWQVVIPNNNRATLGTIASALRDGAGNFQVKITEKTPGLGIESIRQQMLLVWEGQTDRHGTAGPMELSQEAAEEALFIALSVCQQFTRGLVSRIK